MKVLLLLLIVGIFQLDLQYKSKTEINKNLLFQDNSKFEVNRNYVPYNKTLYDSLYKLMNQKKYKDVVTSIKKVAADTLLSKYNVGYVLFAINGKKQVFEGPLQVRKGYDISWDKIQILEINDKSYTLTLGEIRFRTPDNVNVKIGDNIYQASRYWQHKDIAISAYGLDIIIETIINSNNGIICLVGFSRI